MIAVPLRFEPPPAGGTLVLAAGQAHLWRLPAGSDWPALLRTRYGVPALARGAHGKPLDPAGRLALAVSHSGPWLVLALAARGPLGLDLECARPLRRRPRLLQRCFTAAERALLAGADDRLLLRFWILKEALVKAHGRGIAYGLNRIECRLDGEWPALHRVEGEAGPAARWAAINFELAPGCDGTLLAPAPAPALLCFAASVP